MIPLVIYILNRTSGYTLNKDYRKKKNSFKSLVKEANMKSSDDPVITIIQKY